MKTLQEYKLQYALEDEIAQTEGTEVIIYQLLEESANDTNSSRYREEITKLIVGRTLSERKHGYDDDVEAIEVKPANFTGKSKLLAGGNFSDLTWKRHAKYLEDNLTMLVSGFSKGKLLFVVKFPYVALEKRMTALLEKHLPNGDLPSRYVRNASFTYKHWSEQPYHICYVRPTITKYRDTIHKNVYNLLTKTKED